MNLRRPGRSSVRYADVMAQSPLNDLLANRTKLPQLRATEEWRVGSVHLGGGARRRREAQVATSERVVASAVVGKQLGLPPFRARVDRFRVECRAQPLASRSTSRMADRSRRRRALRDPRRDRRAAADARRSGSISTSEAQHVRAGERSRRVVFAYHGPCAVAPSRRRTAMRREARCRRRAAAIRPPSGSSARSRCATPASATTRPAGSPRRP